MQKSLVFLYTTNNLKKKFQNPATILQKTMKKIPFTNSIKNNKTLRNQFKQWGQRSTH